MELNIAGIVDRLLQCNSQARGDEIGTSWRELAECWRCGAVFKLDHMPSKVVKASRKRVSHSTKVDSEEDKVDMQREGAGYCAIPLTVLDTSKSYLECASMPHNLDGKRPVTRLGPINPLYNTPVPGNVAGQLSEMIAHLPYNKQCTTLSGLQKRKSCRWQDLCNES
ncbi:hypothetical protein CHU98_g8048 [Xylaria longipes]|nr:hypothetical protein CHU98_g8048 [Xylaria longipes]